MTDLPLPSDQPQDPLLRELAGHWDDIRDLTGDEQWHRLRALTADLSESGTAQARAALADELLDLLPPDHPVIRVLRTRTMFLPPDAATRQAGVQSEVSTMLVTIYLSDERVHEEVEEAVEEWLATAGLRISSRDEPVAGSWFRRMAAAVRAGMNHPLAHETAVTLVHAADTRLALAQDAAVTATLLQNLSPVLGALHPTKDAVIRAGALLIVKVDWTVNVVQLTAEQQLLLNHRPQLVRTPQEIITILGLMPPGHSHDGLAPDVR